MIKDNNLRTKIIDEAAPDSPKKPVKSTAIVKYSTVPTPATFAQLQCNTDLNLPPSNWLSTSAESYGLQNVWSSNTGFSSFRMAHMFPDCVGEVDVVSGAENIKKLLKLPYSHELVSMMVHRVENTVLLDDFDIHKYLLSQAENNWEWLKKFFYEHVFQCLGDEEKRIFTKANSRNTIQQKNLISKFLHHSLVLANDEKQNNKKSTLPVNHLQPLLPEPSREEKLPDPNRSHNFARNVVWTFENIQMLIGTDMPIFGGQTHPCISLRLRDATKPINVLTGIDYWLDNLMCNVPEVIMCYHLDGIVQKYELIKTEDLPNLNDAKFSPKVIRDIAQNILSFLKNNATKAGHTYWLFKGKNDDVVKLYDLTSLCNDILEDRTENPFTVPVAMLLYRVARNMKYSADYTKHCDSIRMLLKNCIQLLPKEKYPQIVTSAHFMLADLYIPAKIDPANPNLVEQKEGNDSQSECDSPTEKCEQDMNAAIKCLSLSKIKDHLYENQDFEEFKFKPPPIAGTIEDRCQIALEHVFDGLECLKYFPANSKKPEPSINENDMKKSKNNKHTCDETAINMAEPFQIIPIPHETLNITSSIKSDVILDKIPSESIKNSPSQNKRRRIKKKRGSGKPISYGRTSSICVEDSTTKALLCKAESQTLPTWQVPKKDDNPSWSTHLKILLYEKASLVFAVYVENEYSSKNYGCSLRYICAVLRCQKILEIFCSIKNNKLISYLLGRAGDCYFMTVKDWYNVEKHRNDYEIKNVTESFIADAISTLEHLDINEAEFLPERFASLETTLIASHKCYEEALSLEPSETDRNNLLRRLGNIHNELGVLFMNLASSHFHRDETSNVSSQSSDVTSNLVLSLMHLESGIRAFETVHDEANLALLHSNTGRLMRLSAHVNTKQYSQERHFYNKAIQSYQKSLQVLGSRKNNPTIWDGVMWDLSTSFYAIATMLQDYQKICSKSEEYLEREAIEILQRALKYCDMETPGPRQLVYQFRTATIQHRLASLHYKIYKKSEHGIDKIKRKNILRLTRLYYERAAKLFSALQQTTEYLIVQIERIALAEFQVEAISSLPKKIKLYHGCLDLILQSRPIIEVIVKRNKSHIMMENHAHHRGMKDQRSDDTDQELEKSGSDDKKQIEDEVNFVAVLERRLQSILRSLTKLYIHKESGKKENEDLSGTYKTCYALTLRAETLFGISLIERIADVLSKIEKILQQSDVS